LETCPEQSLNDSRQCPARDQNWKSSERANYGQVTDTIVGQGANVRFTLKTIVPDADTTLGEQSEREYGQILDVKRVGTTQNNIFGGPEMILEVR
jgi:hypothetical protein